ncbi:MAG: M15 family metallopeptidase [Clostridiaceae bacterium]
MNLYDLYKPIGAADIGTGWKEVPLEENNEQIVLLDTMSDRIRIESEYYKKGIPGSIQSCYVRSTVAAMLVQASKMLPEGCSLLIYDAWRPVEVQEHLFEDYVAALKKMYPNKAEDDIADLAQKFVSIPCTDLTKPSPHFTGGAVDLTIVDENGCKIDMESDFDSFCEESHTRYYEEKLKKGLRLTLKELQFCLNRRMLYNIMVAVGFTNYPKEWWHFDYGDQFWGYLKKQRAFYGLISS